jgi:hypothetical protein
MDRIGISSSSAERAERQKIYYEVLSRNPLGLGCRPHSGKEAVPDGVKHLIFNCHGYVTRESFGAPHLSIGTVIHKGNISAFERLRNIPELKVIWIAACNIAGGEGLEFCKMMATTSGCYVVAQVLRVPDIAVKSDHIEDYSYAMPVYIHPSAELIGRDKFFELGDALGFMRV